MKTILDFLSTWKEVLDSACNIVVAVAAVATGASAVVALRHYLRHWRDDEVKVAVELDHCNTEIDRDGVATWGGEIKITNVGKVPVTITGFEFADKSLGECFEINDRLYPEVFVYEGAAEKTWAVVKAKQPNVAIPKRFIVRCKWAKAKNRCDGRFFVDTTKTSSAG